MFSQFSSKLNQSLVASFIALVCILVIGVLQVPQLNYVKSRAKIDSPQALQEKVNSDKLRISLIQKIPAFGFDNLFSDWVFLQFVQYFGDEDARKITSYRLSPEYFEVIIDRDPRFLDAYLFLSASCSLYAAMPERSVALMAKGLKSLTPQVPPKSYYVWRYKGIDELLFLVGRTQDTRQSFEKAAEWASIYSDPESKIVVTVSRQTAESLARNPKSSWAQVNGWMLILSNPLIDNRTRKIAISHIEALGGKVIISPDGVLKIQLPPKD